ncbi:MAG: TlpA disulfide reductase family protein [Verrucomicrobiota bacterium]
MLQKLAQDPIKPIADLAAKALDHQQLVAGLKTKPFELKYTAADGSEVDVAKLRGKVVLVDFWATWCGPCVAEMPGVVGLYKKYHPQGFEIVGVSLDQEKGAMESFAKKAGMTWPQYFDGQIWDNKVSSGFGIDQVPQMWLLDKKGMLVATASSVDQVAGQVGELLKAP